MAKLYLILTAIACTLTAYTQTAKQLVQQMKAQALLEQNHARNVLNGQQGNGLMSGASSNYDVQYYNCNWSIDPNVKYITGVVANTFRAVTATNTIILDLSKQLTVDSVVYNNTKIGYTHNTNNTLLLNFGTTLAANSIHKVTVYYKGVPDTNGFGSFSKGEHNGVPVLWTLSEPYGAKDWWPCKDNLTDKADSVRITITCPAIYRSSSNGVIVSDVITGASRTTTYIHRYPITSYLVAMACTNYAVSTVPYTYNGVTMPIETWAYPENAGWFAGENYGVIKALDWFNLHYGPYPFMQEKYAQTQCSFGGGMEHQTNSFVVGPYHLLQAHELAHQWFGDKTTCGSWQHIWVNEGFASFSHWFYYATHDMPTYLGIRYEMHDDVTSDSTGSVYVDDTTSVSRIFDYRLSYEKGAYVLHMLRGILGDATIFNCIKNYSNDPATKYGYATTQDVLRVFEQTSGKQLKEFFKDWIYGQGWPSYHVQWYKNKNGFINLKVNQSQSHPSVSFYEMPIRVQFKNATQDSTIIIDVQQQGQLYATKLNFTPDTVLVDPEMWVLSKHNTQQKLIAPANANNITVTPNPAGTSSWYVTITNPSATTYSAMLYTSTGQLISNATIRTVGGDVRQAITNNTLAKGVYIITILEGNNVVYSKQIVK